MKTTEHILSNVEAVTAFYHSGEHLPTLHQRAIEKITNALGQPRILYFTLGFVVLWIAVNLVLLALAMQPFDSPPFHWLQGLFGLFGVLMTIVILITENRQSKLAEQRGHLDLQVNLLAEKKIAKIIALLEELRFDLPTVKNRTDPEAAAMTEPADPEFVARAIDQQHQLLPS